MLNLWNNRDTQSCKVGVAMNKFASFSLSNFSYTNSFAWLSVFRYPIFSTFQLYSQSKRDFFLLYNKQTFTLSPFPMGFLWKGDILIWSHIFILHIYLVIIVFLNFFEVHCWWVWFDYWFIHSFFPQMQELFFGGVDYFFVWLIKIDECYL